jgi:hemerythrin-like domain-containing protein
MTDSNTPSPSLADVTLEEHRQCMQVVAEVESILDRQPDREGRWLGEIRDKLPELRNTLAAHFRGEEDGPLFRQLPIQAPQLSGRLSRLEEEHQGILESVESLTRRAEKLQDPEVYELRELNAQVQLLIATIRRHEAEENELVMQANWDEIGTGD